MLCSMTTKNMLCSFTLFSSFLLRLETGYAQGKIYKVSRKFIAQVNDDVRMEAYYKNVDLSVTPAISSWYRHGAQLKPGGKFQLSNNNTKLMISDVATGDAGSYKCVLDINNSTFITDFTLVIHKRVPWTPTSALADPIPQWAVALIIVGLVILIICTVAFFRCRKEIKDIVTKRMPKRRKRTYTCETSFQE